MLLHTTNHCFYFSESASTFQPCPCPVVSPLPAHERCTSYLPWESTSCSSQCTPILLPVLRILQLVNTDASCGGWHDAAVEGPYVRPKVLQSMMDKTYGNWQVPGAQQPGAGQLSVSIAPFWSAVSELHVHTSDGEESTDHLNEDPRSVPPVFPEVLLWWGV